jgi:Flp pilus assembly protein TadD
MSEERRRMLRAVLEREPDDATAWFGLGRECLRDGLREQAAEALRRATELDPGYSAAWRDLGRAQLELGQAEAARATLRHGIEVARERGDLQTVREMEVFARRAERKLPRA